MESPERPQAAEPEADPEPERDEGGSGDELGYRNVDEEAEHDESPGPQGTEPSSPSDLG